MVDKMISDKLDKIGIRLEYKSGGGFPAFCARRQKEKILAVCDRNTRPFAESAEIPNKKICFIDEDEPVPDEKVCGYVTECAKEADYVLAVGSGTLNDTAKFAAYHTGKKSGVLATAPSMDGYASPVAPIMRAGFKVSEIVHAPSDILIDTDILSAAPSVMIAAGAGDIMGKYTCLTDWRLAQNHLGEEVNEEAFSDTVDAVDKCFGSIEDIYARGAAGIGRLTDALIVSGLAIAETGNSRPASGAEHHISHYLEMWFVAQKMHVPLHGIKVGLGTLVTAYLYGALERDGVEFRGAEATYRAARYIPPLKTLEEMLCRLGAPTRFSELPISRELFRETMLKAYTVRPRYTVLTLLHEMGLMERYLPQLEEKFY
ncbi:MAG TPA: sn-glycerol-1-phosphate dehydrogenase [Candidatus Borkfalkia excrementavium]|uniref:Sn-glycerol-1-phosphate dehydrogenase n=1 Tax=Candidatus Borkfalkia excrementavium TaxID=2838505 RepID=A0A9D1Z888_9FIRM|nr:sn-glycerol-1-phosphate dehydrogenase [Candidatus Borkfalkia excrementavium]